MSGRDKYTVERKKAGIGSPEVEERAKLLDGGL